MKKVVFYARVSTEEEKQLNALEGQIQELTDYIMNRDGWMLVGSYIDEGKSGTTSKGRKEFNRLQNDLEKGEIDIIVIKDISRLARNVRDFNNFLYQAIMNNVQIYMYLDGKFYEPEDKLIVTIKATIAEEYSRDLSRKIASSAKRCIKNGAVYGSNNLWGYNQENGKLTIIEEEAKLVRRIFELYVEGYGYRKISDKITEEFPDLLEGKLFPTSTITRMIPNQKYMGVFVGGKTNRNFETKTITKNDKSDWIYIDGIIPPIVDKETWYKANEIRKARRIKLHTDSPEVSFVSGLYCFTDKIVCGICGSPYWHVKYKTKEMKNFTHTWQCGEYKRRHDCPNVFLEHTELTNKIKEILIQYSNVNNSQSIEDTMKILRNNLRQNEDEDKIKDLRNKQSKTADKIDDLLDLLLEGVISKDAYTEKKTELENQLSVINSEIENYERKKSIEPITERLKRYEEFLKSKITNTDELSEESIKKIVDKIYIYPDGHITVKLVFGAEYNVPYTFKYKKRITFK